MSVVAAAKCRDGYLVFSDSLVTEGSLSFTSGPKYQELGEMVVGMVGSPTAWPTEEEGTSGVIAASRNSETDFLCVFHGGMTMVSGGRCFPVFNDFYAIGSGAEGVRCAVRALRLRLEGLTCRELQKKLVKPLSEVLELLNCCGGPLRFNVVGKRGMEDI